MKQLFYNAIVENRNDPLQLGRVQVRVFGVHSESLDDVPTSELPWAIPIMPVTSASISGVGNSPTGFVEGSLVIVFFMDGDSKQQPMILGSTHGIPQAKSIFGTNGVLETETFSPASFPIQNSDGTVSAPVPIANPDNPPPQPETATPKTPDTTPSPGKLDISKAVAKYGSNVTSVYQALLDFGIRDDNGCIGILSNVGKECKFKPVRENMTYTTIARIRAVFPSKTKNLTDDQLSKYVNNQQNLANLVYSGKNGNGDEASGDGYKYRGGGFIQLTGRSNYADMSKKVGVDLISNPDQVCDPTIGGKVVAQYMIGRFGGANKIAFDDVGTALSAVTQKVNPGGYNMDMPIVKTESTLYVSNKTPEEIAADAAKAEAKNPNASSNDLDKTATQAQIDKGTTNKTVRTTNIGFKDPNGKWPLTALLKEQDTNRLARRVSMGTLLETKMKNRRADIDSVTDTFSEPLPAYNAIYPNNHIYYSESGHALEFDDTPNAERVQIYHKSGTFTEMDTFGNQVNKIIGDNFSITERNGYIYIDGTARITVGSNVQLQVGGDLNISVDGNLNYDVGGNMTFKVGGALAGKSGNGISMRSDGTIDMDGVKMNLNSNTSKQTDVNARSGVFVDYPIGSPSSFVGEASSHIEDGSSADVSSYLAKSIAAGSITKKELADGAAATSSKTDTTPPATNQPPLSSDCSQFADKTDIPDSTQLTPHYTIGMLSSHAAASSYKIAPQHGLTVSQIACNLKKVALNCLEKVKAQYPAMIVTSGFRAGVGTSQHERGQAIDMQFGVANSDYFDIATWIKDNVLFDQLLLEYKTIESGKAWIHISYADNPRKQIFTYMNHSNAGAGLRKLQ